MILNKISIAIISATSDKVSLAHFLKSRKDMKTLSLLLIALFCFSCAFAVDQETIVVKLDTAGQLMPMYLGKIVSENAAFDSDYITELEEVLRFDLAHNGLTALVNPSKDKESQVLQTPFDNLGNPPFWKNSNVYFVVKARIKDQTLSARVLTVNTQSLNGIQDLQLSGDLRFDRRQVHLLSDAIVRSLVRTEWNRIDTHSVYREK